MIRHETSKSREEKSFMCLQTFKNFSTMHTRFMSVFFHHDDGACNINVMWSNKNLILLLSNLMQFKRFFFAQLVHFDLIITPQPNWHRSLLLTSASSCKASESRKSSHLANVKRRQQMQLWWKWNASSSRNC